MDLKMIVSDLDSTLLKDDKTISDINYEYINRAIDKGILFVLATGRLLISALNYKEQLNSNIPVIASNGAVLTDEEDSVIYKEAVSYDILKKLDQIALEVDIPLYFSSEDHIYSRVSRTNDKYIKNNFNNKLDKRIKVERYNDISYLVENEIDILKSTFISYIPGNLDKIPDKLKDIEGISVTSSGSHNIEIAKEGIDKAKALEYLSKEKNIRPENILAIGDNLNDIGMIKFAGLGVSVSNGENEVLKHADIVTVSNEEDALAKIIKEYIL